MTSVGSPKRAVATDPRALATVAIVTLTAAIIGCGGEPAEPRGPMRADSIGPVRLGMSPGEVQDRFGEPDAKRPVSYGQGQAPQTNWTWTREPGTLVLVFKHPAGHGGAGTLNGYCATSPGFETSMGFRAGRVTGSAVVKVASRAGQKPTLAPDPRSPGQRRNVLLSAGAPGTFPALRFNADNNGDIREICGGYPQPAGE
jgi:hypothetical protein